MDESPFRFVVIDDPVQAMDPARVDGLARVLEQISKTHQVVVFTHDDRLPESVRRLQIPAEVTEVSRQAGSLVSTRPVQDPVRTAIQDALAVALTNQMALGARQKVVPTYCRMAVEAAAASVITRRMLNEGKTRSDIDALLSDERMNLRPLVATVLFDDKDRGSEIQGELHRRCDPNAGWAYKSCNDGAHGDFKDDPEKLAKSTKKLAMWLMEQT